MNSNFKLGIDFHGVINSNPQFFKEFNEQALLHHIEIYIISGGPKETIAKYLNEKKIPYTRLWCIFDYYEKHHNVTFLPDGSFKVADNLWNNAKAEYCKKMGICLHIDDSNIYGRNFQTPYCQYNEQQKTCEIAGKKISFTTNPKKALNELMPYFEC